MGAVLDLDPFAAPPGAIAAIASLGDDPLKPHDTCLPEDDRAVCILDLAMHIAIDKPYRGRAVQQGTFKALQTHTSLEGCYVYVTLRLATKTYIVCICNIL